MNYFAAFAGQWQGTSALHLQDAAPDVSSPTLTITPVLAGRFVRLDYTWAYRGAPQEGSLLIGPDAACGIDTWHMSDKMMIGTPQPDDAAHVFRGSYAAPPGPDWGWSIRITPIRITPIRITPELPDKLRIVMMNIWPGGEREDLAVEAEYSLVCRTLTEPRP